MVIIVTKRLIKKQNSITINAKKEKNELTTFLKILGIVLVVFIVVYLIIAIFFTKDINLFGKKDDPSLASLNNILIT